MLTDSIKYLYFVLVSTLFFQGFISKDALHSDVGLRSAVLADKWRVAGDTRRNAAPHPHNLTLLPY